MNTLAQAKKDFQTGYLTTFRVEKKPEGWVLHLNEGNAAGYLVDTKGNPRTFKTIDAAVAASAQIGFEINALFLG